MTKHQDIARVLDQNTVFVAITTGDLYLTGNVTANGGVGSANQVLTSNGTSGAYWANTTSGLDANTIVALEEKTDLADADIFVIVDTEDSNQLKKFQKSSFSGYMFKALAADDVGQNVATAQPWFPTAGAVTLASDTTYRFCGYLKTDRTAGTTSHTTSGLFGGTATLSNIRIKYLCKTGDTTAAATESSTYSATASAVVVKAASVLATEVFGLYVEGIVRVTTGGTFIPQFQYSVAPGGAPTIQSGSWFELNEIGSAAVVSAGTWT